MRLFKRFRFSLASLLLGVLLLCSGVLLWDKWPAWKVVKTWANTSLPTLPFYATKTLLRKYYSRQAEAEPGAPAAVFPGIKARYFDQLIPKICFANGEYFLILGLDGRLRVYKDPELEAVFVVEPKAFPWEKIMDVKFCEPYDGRYLYVIVEAEHYRVTRIFDIQAKSQVLEYPIQNFTLDWVLRAGAKWYGFSETQRDWKILDLRSGMAVPIPENLGGEKASQFKWFRFSASGRDGEVLLAAGGDEHWPAFHCAVLNLSTQSASEWINGEYVRIPDTANYVWIEPVERASRYHRIKDGQDVSLSPYRHLREFDSSPDGRRVMGTDGTHLSNIVLWDANFPGSEVVLPDACEGLFFSTDSQGVFVREGGNVKYWQNQHPHVWYGVTYLVEFWLTLILSILLLLSIRRDFRALKA